MRVLHVGKFYPPHTGGIERCLATLIRNPCDPDLSQAAFVHRQAGQAPIFSDAGSRLFSTPVHGHALFAPIAPRAPLDLARAIREFKPDLLHLHLPNTTAFALPLLPAARALPWIAHWHADVPADTMHGGLRLAYRLYRPAEAALLRRCRAIIATSLPYANSSSALAPHADRVHVVPLALPDLGDPPPADEAFARKLWPAGRLRLLAVGRLAFFKGFGVAIEAVAALPNTSLAIVGDGPERDSLERLILSLGVADRVQLIGELPPDSPELAATFAQCDAFLFPSLERTEAFGLVLLEAMRAGKPVVASNLAGAAAPWIVQDGVTGLMVPPGDPAALRAAMEVLAEDPELRHRLGLGGRRRFEDDFGIETSQLKLAKVYRQVLSARAPVPPAA